YTAFNFLLELNHRYLSFLMFYLVLNFLALPKAFLVRRLERRLHRPDHLGLIDAFLASDLVDHRDQFPAHRSHAPLMPVLPIVPLTAMRIPPRAARLRPPPTPPQGSSPRPAP